MTAPKPTIGRIVHYTSLDGEIRAAIITGLVESPGTPEGTVSLFIFGKPGHYDQLSVPFSEHVYSAGHWNWPPRD